MDSSTNTKMQFNNLELLFHTASRIHLDAQLMYSIGGVNVDTGYIHNLVSFY